MKTYQFHCCNIMIRIGFRGSRLWVGCFIRTRHGNFDKIESYVWVYYALGLDTVDMID